MIRWLTLWLAAATPAMAFTPPLAGEATVTRGADLALDSVMLPLGPWREDGFPTETAEGRVVRTVWRSEQPRGFTTLSILQPIRDALHAEGWTIRLDCETHGCGGFDFRYAVELFPEPEMHVDLGDFRYVSAARGEERLGVMVSRTPDLGFVEVVTVTPPDDAPPTRPAPVPDPAPQMAEGFERAAVLEGLAFASGSTALGPDQPALDPLLEWLRANPDRRVTLVGHTDDAGSLEANIALSRDRARSVRDWLVARGVDAGRLDAEGVGWLSPRDDNATEEGRARNRRVEVVPD